ncbi:MAG TPA: prepilin-type N-terminal cleavage/methylation domain-containing protein [bacterium]|nr:prepilin-type N-terminal cleavage/methylation domain-containing protein [bacterium]
MRGRGEAGVTLVELLAALAVFALLFLMVDSLFFATNRSTKKTELAADVQQNARIAVERVVREIRESSPESADLFISGATGARSVVFRSARLAADTSVFCLYVRNDTDPSYMNNTGCFTSFVTALTGPPYASDPVAPYGTYTPIWQRYVGYYVEDTDGDGVYDLKRVTAQLTAPAATLATSLSGGDVIATYVESFDVSLSGGVVTISLKARGQTVVQGSTVPAQEILLDGQVVVRN